MFSSITPTAPVRCQFSYTQPVSAQMCMSVLGAGIAQQGPPGTTRIKAEATLLAAQLICAQCRKGVAVRFNQSTRPLLAAWPLHSNFTSTLNCRCFLSPSAQSLACAFDCSHAQPCFVIDAHSLSIRPWSRPSFPTPVRRTCMVRVESPLPRLGHARRCSCALYCDTHLYDVRSTQACHPFALSSACACACVLFDPPSGPCRSSSTI